MILTSNIAHDIREGSRVTAQAVRRVEANCRWAISGTPIQNCLNDLASLYQFLRVYPYDDPNTFREHVKGFARFEKNEAMRRLRALVCPIMLRRSIKTTVTLPERKDLVRRLDFSAAEQTLYNRVKDSTLSAISDEESHQPNALVCINNLRQICNLGVHAQIKSDSPGPNAWNAEVAQDAFNSLIAMGKAICSSCSANLESAAAEVADQTSDSTQPYLYSCLTLVCGRCREGLNTSCPHAPQHEAAPVTTLASSASAVDVLQATNSTELPTKVQSLLDDLEKSTIDEKW